MLLDDPLSAVDPNVANKIFDECIRGHMMDKCVILVTHQLQFLERCPRILLMKEGKTIKQGTFEEIEATGFSIKDILESFNKGGQDGEKK